MWATSAWHENRAWWVPSEQGEEVDNQSKAKFDVFWLHPTTNFFGSWNAHMNNGLTNLVTNNMPMSEQAGVFNGECRIFAPRYRQLSQGVQDHRSRSEQQPALDIAFSDAWESFVYFLNHTGNRPFFVGSFSQGTLHATRVIKRWLQSAPDEQKARFVAWYGIGNTVSEADMEGILPVCTIPRQTFCYISFNTVSFGDTQAADHWKAKGAPTCVNPLSWTRDETLVGSEHHLGALPILSSHNFFVRLLLFPLTGMLRGEPLDDHLLSAQCKEGILYVTDPQSNQSVGHKYSFNPGVGLHANEIGLFWKNLRVNIRERAEAFLSKHV